MARVPLRGQEMGVFKLRAFMKSRRHFTQRDSTFREKTDSPEAHRHVYQSASFGPTPWPKRIRQAGPRATALVQQIINNAATNGRTVLTTELTIEEQIRSQTVYEALLSGMPSWVYFEIPCNLQESFGGLAAALPVLWPTGES